MTLLASTVPDWIGAASALLTAAFAVFGVAQLFDIRRQTKQTALANVSQSYAQISDGMASLRSMLLENPEWSKYFYEGVHPQTSPLDGADSAIEKLNQVCDQIVDLVDTVIEQRNTVPGAEMDWSTWDAYFRFLYQQSPLLQEYLRDNIAFYPDYVLTVFGYVIVRADADGEVQSEWSALESETDEDAHRFPWFRTWTLTRIGDDASPSPAYEAVTRPDPSGSSNTAEVRISRRNGEDEAAERAFRDWLLAVLQASARLDEANVFLDGATEPARFSLRAPRSFPWRKPPRRERYLAPTFREG